MNVRFLLSETMIFFSFSVFLVSYACTWTRDVFEYEELLTTIFVRLALIEYQDFGHHLPISSQVLNECSTTTLRCGLWMGIE
jgi:hypothetical protein